MLKILKPLLLSIMACGILLLPGVAHAVDLLGPSCSQAPDSSVCKQAAQQGTTDPITHIINTAANIIAIVGGVAAVVMIIIAGLTFITSSGNAERVTTARRRILYSIIGLVVISLAWTITRFITSRVVQ
jgi:hypothetical protein